VLVHVRNIVTFFFKLTESLRLDALIEVVVTTVQAKSISSHEPDEASGSPFFHPDSEKRPSRAPVPRFHPDLGFYPSGEPRPSPAPGARSGSLEETNARETPRKVPARLVAPTCRRERAVVGIGAEDGEAGAAVRTADQRAQVATGGRVGRGRGALRGEVPRGPRPRRQLHADGHGAHLVHAGLGEGAGGAAVAAAGPGGRVAPAQPARGAPVVKLEDSSDGDGDWYRPTPPRFGDAGQGSSCWTPGQSSQQAPHRRMTAATPATTTAATTRRSTAVWACRTPCF
jgi:hypothetical protein